MAAAIGPLARPDLAAHRRAIQVPFAEIVGDAQAGLLKKHFRHAGLMLDGDLAGRAATASITRHLSQIMEVEAIHLKPGDQPDQLAPREMNETLSGHLRSGRGLER